MAEINSQDATTAAPGSGQPAPGGERLYAGKYRTVEELEKGYGHLLTAGNTVIDKNRELETRLNALMPLLENGQDPNRSHSAGGAPSRGQALARLAEATGIDLNQLRADLRGEASDVVAPITGAIAASQMVERDNPDFSKYRGEIAQFLASSPELKARVDKLANSGDPDLIAAGADLAVTKWKQTLGNGTTTRIDATGEQQLNARLDATIAASGSGGRDITQQSDYQAKTQAAIAKGRASGRKDGPAWSEFLDLALGDLHAR